MLTAQEAQQFAEDWCEGWNSHDLNLIMAHYTENVVLTSPTAVRLLKDPSGQVVGKDALRNYFSIGLQAYPNLKFRVLDVTCGVSSMVIYYENQNGARVSELMEFDSDRKVTKVVAHYNT